MYKLIVVSSKEFRRLFQICSTDAPTIYCRIDAHTELI